MSPEEVKSLVGGMPHTAFAGWHRFEWFESEPDFFGNSQVVAVTYDYDDHVEAWNVSSLRPAWVNTTLKWIGIEKTPD
jgi:hypothetical protein